MKRSLYLFLPLVFAAASLRAQVIVTESNFNAQTDSAWYQRAIKTDQRITLPGTGTNQTWNYTNLQDTTYQYYIAYQPAGMNPPFAGATMYGQTLLSLGPILLPIKTYYGLTSNGLIELGYTLPADTIHQSGATVIVPAQSVAFVPGKPVLDFPAATGQYNVLRSSATTNFIIDAPPLYSHAPGTFTSITADNTSYSGDGILRLPKRSFKAVLQHTTERTYDSVLINGAPASPFIMAAFGLQQGWNHTREIYNFWGPNNGFPLLFFNMDSTGVLLQGGYSINGTSNFVDGVSERVASQQASLYPNPATAGHVSISLLKTDATDWVAHVIDLTGTQIATIAVRGTGNVTAELPLDRNTTKGAYIYQVRDGAGNVKASGRFVAE